MGSPRMALAGIGLAAMAAAFGYHLAARSRAPAPVPEPSHHEPAPQRPARRAVALAEEPPLEPSAAERAEGHGRWSELNNEAVAALEEGELERALELLEQCFSGAPDADVFRRNLAEVLARAAMAERKLERACRTCLERLERAAALVPEREELARLLQRWRAEEELESGFWADSSVHFDISYDGSRTELLKGSHRLLEVLENGYDDMGLFFGTYPVETHRRRLPVVLYERTGFGAVTGLGDWAGGAFDGTIRVPIEDLGREEAGLRSILRHELVHAFVAEVGGPKVPGWLNEGLAQWLEGPRQEAVARARNALAGQELFELGQLEGSLSTWEDPEKIRRAYAQSLVLVDRIAHDYGEQVLVEMVKGVRAGRKPAETFRDRTRLGLETVLGDL